MNESTSQLTEKIVGKNVRAAPRVSVVIPAYNISAYIAETLESVFAQTYKDYEIILINDGSTDTDELKRALAPYLDRIIYAEQKNAGASQARNAAVRLARGELAAFLDGDDVWLPDFLRSQTDFLEKETLEMVYCDALIFGDTPVDNEKFTDNAPSSGAVTPVSLISAECHVITSGTVLKKDLLDKFGTFDVSMRRGQDFEMWFRLAKNGVRIGYQRTVLLKYRVRTGNLTGTNVDRAERNITVMNRIREKYDFDQAEQAAWDAQMLAYEAERDYERGKSCLANGDFAGARTHLAAANEFYRKPKLSLLNYFLRIAPRTTARLYRRLRPAEFPSSAPPSVSSPSVGAGLIEKKIAAKGTGHCQL